MKDTVTLKSEVLQSGMGCPICGGYKTETARTCRDCYTKHCPEATQAVDAVLSAINQAAAGHAVAVASSGQVARNTIWERPVLTQVEIGHGSNFKSPTNGVQPYWDSQIQVVGGYVSLFVFGAQDNQRGEKITALVELKTKEVPDKKIPGQKLTVHYLRAQTVAGVQSNVELRIFELNRNPNKSTDDIIRAKEQCQQGLPCRQIRGKGPNFIVGFKPINSALEPEDGYDTATREMLAEISH